MTRLSFGAPGIIGQWSASKEWVLGRGWSSANQRLPHRSPRRPASPRQKPTWRRWSLINSCWYCSLWVNGRGVLVYLSLESSFSHSWERGRGWALAGADRGWWGQSVALFTPRWGGWFGRGSAARLEGMHFIMVVRGFQGDSPDKLPLHQGAS